MEDLVKSVGNSKYFLAMGKKLGRRHPMTMTTALLVPSASPHQEEKPPAYEHKSWLLKTEMVT